MFVHYSLLLLIGVLYPTHARHVSETWIPYSDKCATTDVHYAKIVLSSVAASRRALVRLQNRVARKFPLVEQAITLPWSKSVCHILTPASFDGLLTAAENDPEQNMPYWATVWASGIALGDLLLQRREQVAGLCAVELGSGLGVTAIAAAAAGIRLTATDYSPETLLLCRANVLRNVAVDVPALRANWRKPSAALLKTATPPLPLVLAADVLYEERDVEPLAALAERLLAPDGELWLAEPGRRPAQRFVAAACMAGWQAETVTHNGPWPDPGDRRVRVRIHILRRTGVEKLENR